MPGRVKYFVSLKTFTGKHFRLIMIGLKKVFTRFAYEKEHDPASIESDNR